ncbi:hypothetical protein M758_UG029800 [Ceratodon purpureus]|nr:hypothetical protein M758_UG029800 [Ceratodon purpureus]
MVRLSRRGREPHIQSGFLLGRAGRGVLSFKPSLAAAPRNASRMHPNLYFADNRPEELQSGPKQARRRCKESERDGRTGSAPTCIEERSRRDGGRCGTGPNVRKGGGITSNTNDGGLLYSLNTNCSIHY